jgi:LCP family protein required for cell wall assembly
MGYYGKHRLPGSRRPVLKAVAASTAMVLLVLAGSVFLMYRHLEGNITISQGFQQITEPRPDEVEVEGPKQPLNILILGSDTRAGQSDVLGDTPGLSDTTILLHLSADRERAYGVSIPRDLMVPRPECQSRDGESTVPAADMAQWNDAYALGGEACTVAQFEMMSDLRVNHFVVVDFNGFKSMVDALGGVPVCVPKEVDDPIGDIYLPAGSYEVTGNQALNYVRVRHEISDNGDIGRMRRQQEFLASMVNKAVSAGTLFNPPRLLRFLNAGTKSLTTDPGLSSLRDLIGLAQEVRGIGLNRVQFFTVPFGTYEPDPNRLALADGADQLWQQLRRDVPLDRQFTQGAAKASKPKPNKPDPTRSAEAAENGLCA